MSRTAGAFPVVIDPEIGTATATAASGDTYVYVRLGNAALATAVPTLSTEAVTAAGTTITTATDLTASINVVTTAAASSGVQLPQVQVGDSVEILNLGANPVTVYPDSASNRINALSTGSGFLLATNTAA